MRPPTGHCAFDGATIAQAFDDLVAWIERGVRPAGEDYRRGVGSNQPP
jgi:hypothetical protein